MLTNLLENAERNLANEDELKLFEVGSVLAEAGPRMCNNRCFCPQDTWLAALYTAKKTMNRFGARVALLKIFQTWQKMRWLQLKIFVLEHRFKLGKIKLGMKKLDKC